MEVGLPAGVVNFLSGPGSRVGSYLVAHPQIDFVAFTGSVPVGKHLAGLAAAVMKPTLVTPPPQPETGRRAASVPCRRS